MSEDGLEKGIPFIVSAPSGAGKTTLCSMAVEFFPDLRFSVSYTTRKPRDGEEDGVDYHFIQDRAFDEMVENGDFIEYADVHGKRYGTSREDLAKELSGGTDILLDIDVQGAGQVRRNLEDGVYIFIIPPSFEEGEKRLLGRGQDTPEEIKRRVEASHEEIKRAVDYDYVIVNDRPEDAFELLKAVIIAEKARGKRVLKKVGDRLGI